MRVHKVLMLFIIVSFSLLSKQNTRRNIKKKETEGPLSACELLQQTWMKTVCTPDDTPMKSVPHADEASRALGLSPFKWSL